MKGLPARNSQKSADQQKATMALVLRKIYEGYDYYFNESKGECIPLIKLLKK